MEGDYFLGQIFVNSLSIGLCINDGTNGLAKRMKQSTQKFIDMVARIEAMPKISHYVMQGFLKVKHIKQWSQAL